MTARVLEHPERRRLRELDEARTAGEIHRQRDEMRALEVRLLRLALRIDRLLEEHGIRE